VFSLLISYKRHRPDVGQCLVLFLADPEAYHPSAQEGDKPLNKCVVQWYHLSLVVGLSCKRFDIKSAAVINF
jgi:hypothetical protein